VSMGAVWRCFLYRQPDVGGALTGSDSTVPPASAALGAAVLLDEGEPVVLVSSLGGVGGPRGGGHGEPGAHGGREPDSRRARVSDSVPEVHPREGRQGPRGGVDARRVSGFGFRV
jgi:hypothetical protein